MSGAGGEGRRAATRLRLVSWNVHGTPDAPRREERMRAVARVISARKPDLVLLQEVWRRRDAAAFEKRLARKGYAAVRVPSAGSGLLGFVRASVGWRLGEPRLHAPGVHGFTLSRDGFSGEVLNVHLAAQRAQLAPLRALAEAVEGRPVLVAGSLDTTPDPPAWQELAGFRDLTARLREACGCGTAVRAEEPSPWLDHLLARLPVGWSVEAEVSLLRSLRPDVPYSDHHGLDAVLQIEAPRVGAGPAPRAGAGLAALAAARLAGPTTRRELLANAALWWLAR